MLFLCAYFGTMKLQGKMYYIQFGLQYYYKSLLTSLPYAVN